MILPDDISFIDLYRADYYDHWQHRGLIKNDGVNRFHAFITKDRTINMHYDIVKKDKHLKKNEYKIGHKYLQEKKIRSEINRIRSVQQEYRKSL